MKTREQVEHVEEESYDYTRTFYVCEVEGCGFETEEKEAYEKHYGQTHAAKEARMAAGIEFVRLETEADQDAYVQGKALGDSANMSGWYGGNWDGPGWYGFEGKLEPCRRGCCSNFEERLHPVSYFEEQWAAERDKLNAKLDQLQPLLKPE
jgi:hypothetical protein